MRVSVDTIGRTVLWTCVKAVGVVLIAVDSGLTSVGSFLGRRV